MFRSACATTRSTTPCKHPTAPSHATRVPLCVNCSILTRFPVAVRRTFHFPDAYYGQNTKIRETLNNLILKAPQEWHTQVALPFVKIVGTTVEWDE